jgi:uncharacterized protein (TIGR02001 family)
MKKFITAAAVAALFAHGAAFAEEPAQQAPANEPAETKEEPASPYGTFSATITGVTDYRDRGISQSDESPAIQGSIDWEHDSGLYAGVWASRVDFNDGGEAKFELDTYLGYAHEWGGFEWDYMVNGIFYPTASDTLDYDLVEFTVAASRDIGFVNAKGSVIFSPDNSGDSGPAWYPRLDLEAPIMETGFTATGSLAHQFVDDKVRYGLPDYTDWSLGAKYSWQGIDFGLSYVDTNLSKAQCADGCDAAVVFSIGHTFGGGE